MQSGAVGFMGPTTSKANPSYREVCSGSTGHVEVYDVEFDGKEDTYEQLVRHFFSFHDPTTLNAQGNDRGTQYASVLYCYDDIQVRGFFDQISNFSVLFYFFKMFFIMFSFFT